MFAWLKKAGSASPNPPNRLGAAPPTVDSSSSIGVINNAQDDPMHLGDRALSEGDFIQASAYFRHAVARHPEDVIARVGLGFALVEQMCYPEAKVHLNRASLLDPCNPDAWYLLGRLAFETGDKAAAIENFNEVLALNPDFEYALRDLSRALFESGFKDKARQLIATGMARFPTSADFHYYQGNLFVDDRRFEEAIACYHAALALRPDYAAVLANMSHAQVELGRLEPAIANARRAIALQPDSFTTHDSLLWALLFLPGGANHGYVEAARNYGALARSKATPFTSWCGQSHASSMTSMRPRLRVGLVSGDFRVHAVGIMLEGMLPRLGATNWDLVAYSMNPRDDGLTERIKFLFTQWIPIAALSDEQLAHRIHSDRVDILIDLSGHSAHNRLPVFAWKPAPVQLSWLGYLASTGVPGIDFVLADPVSAPQAIFVQFNERVWHLPETFNCFTPPPDHPRLAVAAPPVLRTGYISFGSFQRMNKINQAVLALWARILLACPGAVLRLQNAQLGDSVARARVIESLSALGISSSRLILGGETADRHDYLASYAKIDIVLDTFPYPGVTTTGEALWMGVPTVTLCGDTLLQRIGASLMTCAGLGEWVARSEDEYVALALKRAADWEALARLRAVLRQQVAATALFDAGRFAARFEEALRAMWKKGERQPSGTI